MRLLLGFATLTLIVSNTVQTVQNRKVLISFESASIVPYIIPEAPENILEVRYSVVSPCLGDVVSPYIVREVPELTYDFEPDVNYTLLFIAPDFPSSTSSSLGSVTLWLVVNIPGDRVEDGCVIASYLPPSPKPGAGYHRYIYLVYAQNTTIDTTDRKLLRLAQTRIKLNVSDFVEQYDLGDLIAGNYFISGVPAIEDEPEVEDEQEEGEQPN